MIFETPDNDSVTVGSIRTKAISISANAKAYRLIFGQIYPDIIKAIVRELFTNAWDSQKVAGTLQTPIDIHLPTDFEPWFSIRDYGTGMTPEIIDDVYTRVFESTKDQSNEEAGQFGMGSKTPLGYTDSFSVTSYVNGRMWAYSIYINTRGEAELGLQYEGETDEPNGVFVQVGVKRDDFDNFKQHAETFALHAGTPININRSRFLNTRNPLMSGENWTLYEKNENFENAMFVRMGCVLYRLNVTMLLSNLKSGYNNLDYNARNHIRELFDMPLVIDFPIGTFEVTGSREDIVYTAAAAELIFNRVVNEVVTEITENIAADISQAKTFGEAYRLSRSYQNLKLLINEGWKNLKWKSWKFSHINRFVNQRTGSRFAFNPYSRRAGTLIKSFTPSSIDPHMMYDPDAITYVVIDNGNVKRPYSRLSNLVDCLNSAGLKRCTTYNCNINRSGKAAMYNILWVHEKYSLKRLRAILPEKHVIINLEDINLSAPKARVPREEVEINVDTYHIYDDGWTLKLTRWESAPKSQYYVRAFRRKLIDDEDKIRTACAALHINPGNVCVINKLSEHLIEHHDLKDLFKEAEKIRDSVTYNSSTVFHNVMNEFRHVKSPAKLQWMHYSKDTVALWLKIDYKEEDVSFPYTSDVNQNVAKVHEEMKQTITQRVEQLLADHPLVRYVSDYHFQSDEKFTEILKILGEI